MIKLYQEENTRYSVKFDKGILQDMERPLLPKLSYLIQKYAKEDDIDAIVGGNSGPASEMHTSINDIKPEKS